MCYNIHQADMKGHTMRIPYPPYSNPDDKASYHRAMDAMETLGRRILDPNTSDEEVAMLVRDAIIDPDDTDTREGLHWYRVTPFDRNPAPVTEWWTLEYAWNYVDGQGFDTMAFLDTRLSADHVDRIRARLVPLAPTWKPRAW